MWEVSLGLNVNYLNFLLVGNGTGTFCIKVVRKSYSPPLTVVFNFLENVLTGSLLMSAATASVKSLFCCCISDAEQRRLTGPCAADAGVNLVRIWDTCHMTDSKDLLNSWQSHSWRPTASRLSAPAVQMACVRNASYAGQRSQKSWQANKCCGVIPHPPLTSSSALPLRHFNLTFTSARQRINQRMINTADWSLFSMSTAGCSNADRWILM